MQIAVTLGQLGRVRGLVRRSAPIAEPWILERFEELRRTLGLSGRAELRESSEVAAPQVMGLLRPVVLLPSARTLSQGDLSMALCHELVHVRRADLWWGWIPALAQRLFWFHPLVLLAAREYSLAREAACDAEVLRVLDPEPQAYGRLLLRLGIAPRAAKLAAAGAAPSVQTLKRRLQMLEQSSETRRLPLGGVGVIVLVAALAVVPFKMVAQPAPPAPPEAPAAVEPAEAPEAPAAIEPTDATDETDETDAAEASESPEAPEAPEAPAPVETAEPAPAPEAWPTPPGIPTPRPTPTAVAPAAPPAPASLPTPAPLPARAPRAVPAVSPAPPAPMTAPTPRPAAMPRPAAARGVRVAAAPPAPPTPPTAPPAPRPMSPGKGDSYILLLDGNRAVMNGTMSDVSKAKALQTGGEPLLYVRQGGKAYVVRDAATVKAAQELFRPQQELGDKQGELGGRQGELGGRQGALGAKQGALGAQQATLAARRVRGDENASADLDRRMEDLSRQQEELGRQQEELGRQQEALGRQQEELGRRQEKLAKEAEVKLRSLIDSAVRSGKAQPVK